MTAPTTAAPDWLEKAAKSADAATTERVPLKGAAEAIKPKPRPGVAVEPALEPPPPAEAPAESLFRYDRWALLPSTLALAAATVGALVYLWPLIPASVRWEALGAVFGSPWLVQLFRAGYRLLAFRYRLTDTQIERRLGLLYPREQPLSLAVVARTEVRRRLVERLTGVGTVVVIPEGTDQPPLALAGVRNPHALAEQIEEAARAARERNVVTARVKG